MSINYQNLQDAKGAIGSFKRDMFDIMTEFNENAKGLFEVSEEILIPAQTSREFDRTATIVRHIGQPEEFDSDFDMMEDEIVTLAKKLDKRSSIHELSFREEFAKKEAWVNWQGTMTAYNYYL